MSEEEDRTLPRSAPRSGARETAVDDDGPSTLAAPPPAPSAPPTGPLPASASRSRAGTPTETTTLALRGDEAARARVFARAVVALCVVGLAIQAISERTSPLRPAIVAAHLGLGVVGAWVWRRTSRPGGYTRAVFRVFGVSAVLAGAVFVAYFGVFSPVSSVVVLGLAFFALSEDGALATALAVGLATLHLAGALAITAGVFADPGVFVPTGAGTTARLTMALMIYLVYLAAIVQGRSGRRSMAEAIERSNAAARLARDRQAQLEEARENLDIALRGGGLGGARPGTTCGRFALDALVGRGAMGEVYAATEIGGERRAAVKLLHGRALESPETTRRFLREADITRALSGPNLVEVLEVGETADGVPFLAMELLEGEDLGALLRRRTQLPLDEARAMVEDVARGLDVAHRAGVVHRDLKPSNLFAARGDGGQVTWKILDFGVSRFRGSRGTLTEGHVVGTPGYMSPEQAQGKETEAAADLFSLGAVLYRALTGRRPFTGGDVPQILYGVVYTQPPRPREIAAHLPRDVEAVLAIALAKRARDRFASAPELAAAFQAAARGRLGDTLRRRAEAILASAPWAHLDGRTGQR